MRDLISYGITLISNVFLKGQNELRVKVAFSYLHSDETRAFYLGFCLPI